MRYWITLTLVTLGVLLLGIGFVQLVQYIGVYDVEINDGTAKLEAINAERTSTRELAMLLNERSDDMARIKGIFVDPERPIRFIESVEALGVTTQCEVLLNIVGVDTTTHEMRFHFDVSGSEQDLFRFLELLDLMPYVMHVERVEVELAGVRDATHVVEGKMFLTVSVRTDPLR
jgi:hypothetical protein